MGAVFSQAFHCFSPAAGSEPYTADAPLDETLGHSFCYVRSSARFAVSPAHSDRFLSPSHSFRLDHPSHQRPHKPPGGYPESWFRTISGAAVSANTSTPITLHQSHDICDDAAGFPRGGFSSVSLDGFESTSSFSALPLQLVPRGCESHSTSLERTFFTSGPIERGATSGPLAEEEVLFSAPLGAVHMKKSRKKKSKTLYRNFSVVPLRNFINGGGRKEFPPADDSFRKEPDGGYESNVQWALGKAGEDRVHVVVSEELGWLFVGIYDGFNGPDAPEFLMSHLYKAMYNELEGLFWESEDVVEAPENEPLPQNPSPHETENRKSGEKGSQTVKNVMFGGEQIEVRRRRLWEYFAADNPEEGLDLSGSQRFAFSLDDAISVNNAGSALSRRSQLLSKLKHGLLSRHKDKEDRKLFPWKFWFEGKHKAVEEMANNNNVAGDETDRTGRTGRKRKVGLVDHSLVLSAMARALEVIEQAYLDMTDRVLDRYPELALMGSCLLVALMRDEDVYVMNVGDSRAIVAQCEAQGVGPEDGCFNGEGIIEQSGGISRREGAAVDRAHAPQRVNLTALQLSTDHSTSIEEEVIRIKNEHLDDSNCIVNGRVKGRLKVTRAFGAGFLKQPLGSHDETTWMAGETPAIAKNTHIIVSDAGRGKISIMHKWNDGLLEMFRNDYIGTAPYVSCSPSLRHHKLLARDQFLVLSSDGLYQYFSNEEAVAHVQSFMERFPDGDGDPAQHLIEELLLRAARKAGMDFHELLDIPQGDRRKYHDDVTVMVVSLEGRIWKSSGKYL